MHGCHEQKLLRHDVNPVIYVNVFSEIDIYPAQFSFHSKSHPTGSVVRRQDTVFVEVVYYLVNYSGAFKNHFITDKVFVYALPMKKRKDGYKL